jgi:hypothetical protein
MNILVSEGPAKWNYWNEIEFTNQCIKKGKTDNPYKAKKLRFDHTEDIIAKPPKKALCSKVFH